MQSKNNNIVLLTGAGGYIGSVVLNKLVENGYKVRALDAFYWGIKPIEHLKTKVEIVKCDIRDIKPTMLEGVENVIHTAGLSNDPMADFNPKANFQINTQASAKLAKLCKDSKIHRFIFASSASIYDRKNGGKIFQDENSNVIPTAAYSVSKLKAEKAILKLADKKFCPVIFRQGTVYGYSPRLRYDLVINTMVKDALQKGFIRVFDQGKQWRPLVDVNDVAKAYILSLESLDEEICGKVFNLFYKNYTVMEIAKSIQQVLLDKFNIKINVSVEISKKRGRNYKILGDKLANTFGWKPTISIEKSTEDLVKKIKKNKNTDFDHPRYYNIEWMKLLVEAEEIIKVNKKIF